jgi:hypothetical protein
VIPVLISFCLCVHLTNGPVYTSNVLLRLVKLRSVTKYVTNMPTNIFMSTVSNAMIGQCLFLCLECFII